MRSLLLLLLPLTLFSKPDQMRADLHYLTEFLPHRSGVINLNIAADYIETQFKKMKLPVTRQSYNVSGSLYHNIIAELNPDLKKTIIIGAHYDTVPNTPGADDNGSGVAALLEISRKITQIKDQIPYRVILIAYTLEEPPYFDTERMGSYIHAASLKKSGVKPEGIYILEMLGYYSDQENTQRYPVNALKLIYPSKGNFIAAVSDFRSSHLAHKFKVAMSGQKLSCEKLIVPGGTPGINLSDHRNYWHFKFPAIMITDTAFYRNQNYHKPTDTLGTLDLKKIGYVVNGMVQLLQK